LFAVLNQALRKLGESCCGAQRAICRPIKPKRFPSLSDPAPVSPRPPRTELPTARAWLSDSAAGLLEEIYDSPRKTQVIQKAMVWGYAIWAFRLGSVLTYVVLAGVTEALSSLSVGMVLFLFLLIGITMFLIPVVPGLAVYLAGGVLVVRRMADSDGDSNFDSETDFYLAGLLTTMLCYGMKLVAHVLQQKIFGEQLGELVSIRVRVCVNSSLIRAIKYIIMQPGLSLAKVCILCGGPDWPTSVLCGILRRSDPKSINTLQLVIGLTPIVVPVIAPTVFAAAFLLRTGEDGPYSTIASIALLTSTGMQLMLFVGLMHYVTEVIDKHKDVLDSYEVDTEVEQLEIKQKQQAETTAEVTKIGSLPPFYRRLLLTGAVLVVLSSYPLMLAPSQCFFPFDLVEHQITQLCVYSCSDTNKDAFVEPLGLCIMLMLAVGIGCSHFFSRAAARMVNSQLAQSGSANHDRCGSDV